MFGKKKQGILGGESSSGNSITESIPGFQEDPACAKYCPKLTYQQRLIGFFSCAVFGWILSLVGTLTLIGGATDENIRIFAILYVLGNVIALSATGFLLGPKSQCRKMWAPTRRYTTAFYLTMLIVVLIVAVLKQNVFLVLFLLFIEVLAAVWYSISYIPFGRKIVIAFFRRTGVCMPCFYVYDQAKEGYEKTKKATANAAPEMTKKPSAAKKMKNMLKLSGNSNKV